MLDQNLQYNSYIRSIVIDKSYNCRRLYNRNSFGTCLGFIVDTIFRQLEPFLRMYFVEHTHGSPLHKMICESSILDKIQGAEWPCSAISRSADIKECTTTTPPLGWSIYPSFTKMAAWNILKASFRQGSPSPLGTLYVAAWRKPHLLTLSRPSSLLSLCIKPMPVIFLLFLEYMSTHF